MAFFQGLLSVEEKQQQQTITTDPGLRLSRMTATTQEVDSENPAGRTLAGRQTLGDDGKGQQPVR
ncbi:hypothetical protein [Candidatus Avelusimicrobium stercoris]|uniref:hypothetical protein n=1 Tax=Candidatus Avelusimicrobium stercoris TaxID=1947924 RepID=UPI003D1436D7